MNSQQERVSALRPLSQNDGLPSEAALENFDRGLEAFESGNNAIGGGTVWATLDPTGNGIQMRNALDKIREGMRELYKIRGRYAMVTKKLVVRV